MGYSGDGSKWWKPMTSQLLVALINLNQNISEMGLETASHNFSHPKFFRWHTLRKDARTTRSTHHAASTEEVLTFLTSKNIWLKCIKASIKASIIFYPSFTDSFTSSGHPPSQIPKYHAPLGERNTLIPRHLWVWTGHSDWNSAIFGQRISEERWHGLQSSGAKLNKKDPKGWEVNAIFHPILVAWVKPKFTMLLATQGNPRAEPYLETSHKEVRVESFVIWAGLDSCLSNPPKKTQYNFELVILKRLLPFFKSWLDSFFFMSFDKHPVVRCWHFLTFNNANTIKHPTTPSVFLFSP